MGSQSGTAITVKCCYPVPRRRAVYAAEGGVREEELPKPLGAQIVSLRDPILSFTLLGFGFALILLLPCPGSSLLE